MKCDVEIDISGSVPIKPMHVAGVQLTYSYNFIPSAHIDLAVAYMETTGGKDLLCNPDQFKASTRQSPVTITVKSKTGCISFKGFFDGLSVNQTVGGVSYSAVFKNQFQYLNEVYPKFIGADPSSLLPFKRLTGLQIIADKNDPYEQYRGPLAAAKATLTDKSLLEGVVEMFKASLNAQLNATEASNMPIADFEFLKIFQESQYQEAARRAIQYLEDIDFSAVADSKLRASRSTQWLVETVLNTRGTVWESLIQIFSELGCVIVAGNDKLFVVPQAAFMKASGVSVPSQQERATRPNVAYPADYSSFSISDVSYKNLRACITVPTSIEPISTMYSAVLTAMGAYPVDGSSLVDDGATGILSVEAPQALLQNIEAIYLERADDLNKISTGETLAATEVPSNINDSKQKIVTAVTDAYTTARDVLQEALNDYAQARFLQEKYFERGGSINLEFKPNWVPASTGTLYARRPGLFYCFFVATVVHSITVGNSNTGAAVTQVNFNSTRYAGSFSQVAGADEVTLYQYNAGKMSSFQSAWLDDINGKVNSQ